MALKRVVYGAMVMGLAAAGVSVALRHREGLAAWWGRMRFPPGSVPAADAQGREILRQIDAERLREVSRAYERVQAEVSAVPEKDFNRKDSARREALEADLSTAMSWAKAGRYREAMLLINSVEVRAPRSGEAVGR